MLVKFSTSGMQEAQWHEYATRFVLGGLITVAAGLIAKRFGASVGGLFLGFPAIFPATATLVQKHERKRKQEHGLSGERRALDVAAADAIGTAMGSIGMAVFALLFWLLIPRLNTVLTLVLALLGWGMVAGTVWLGRKKNVLRWRSGRLVREERK